MKIGFIGCGNMASAIMGGIIKSNIVPAADIIGSDAFAPTLEKAAKNLGIATTSCNKEVAKESDVLFLAVKPQFYADVITEIKDIVKPSVVVVTIAPGWSLEKLKETFGKDIKIVRTMPNTPAMVLEGMTAVCPNEFVTKDELDYVMKLLSSFGKCQVIKEYLIDAVIVASGSSPAFVYMFIEALADAAVIQGMPRDMAYKFAAQGVLGSAKMVLETELHPGALKDMVCSPAGTTIEAVRVLEERGFRSSIIEAAVACAEKSKSM